MDETPSMVEVIRFELRRTKRLGERALEQVDDAGFFAVDDPTGNSPAILVKHLAGNMQSRWRDFLRSDGEKPDRDRDGEFEVGPDDTRAALMEAWDAGWATLFGAVDPLDDADLVRTVTIRGEPLSVAQAVLRQTTHYAYHVGQIVQLVRTAVGPDWRSLTIPRGGSKAFNDRPRPYVPRATDD